MLRNALLAGQTGPLVGARVYSAHPAKTPVYPMVVYGLDTGSEDTTSPLRDDLFSFVVHSLSPDTNVAVVEAMRHDLHKQPMALPSNKALFHLSLSENITEGFDEVMGTFTMTLQIHVWYSQL